MTLLNFKRHRFPPEIIRRSVWLHAGFTLRLRDVAEILAQRGLDISCETVFRCFLKVGTVVAANLRRRRPKPRNYWKLDEMAVVIRGHRCWLWRAVDSEGEVLDFLVPARRDTKAALKLMKKSLKRQGFSPNGIVTGKLRSYRAAFRDLGIAARHDQGLRASNRAENSHLPIRRRERKMQRFKSPGGAQRSLSIHAATDNRSTTSVTS